MLTEKTIDQILGVLDLTAKNHESGLSISKAYQKSVKEIAQRYSIKYQTIADGCRRRLGLVNVNQFVDLLREWLGGQPYRLRDLLSKNTSDFEQYRINDFFDRKELTSSNLSINKNLETVFEIISLKAPQNMVSQLRALAESEGKSVHDLSVRIIKEYVDKNYVEYLRNFINSLPQSQKEQVLAELAKGLESK